MGADALYKLDPTWSTARLILRRPRDEDVGDVFAYASDPVVTRFADWETAQHLQQVMEVIQGWQRDWEAGREFTWVVTEPPSDRVIGAVSCSRKDAEFTLGYVLDRAYWAKGYATEVAAGLAERLLADPTVQLIRATCDEENLASRRVLEKAGFTLRGRAPRDVARPQISATPRPACLYERLRSG
jgi:ribosomal-protein-alanine N-acetyltransferase